jgi:hypothetical protein
MTLVAGVGPGLFALIFVTVLALLIGLAVAFVKPNIAVPVGIGCLCLPLLTFGLIMAAPVKGSRDGVLPDDFYIPRVIFIIVMLLGALAGPGYWVGVIIFGAPKYQAPDVACRRKKLQALHPDWCK